MEVEEEQREMTTNKVMCLFTDPEGTPLGAPMYLPQNAGPQELQQMVNKLLNNVSFASGFWFFDRGGLFGCWESVGKEN